MQLLPSLKSILKSTPLAKPLIAWKKSRQTPLTQDQFAYFHHNGYLIVDTHIPMETIDAASMVMRTRADMKNPTHHGTRLFDGWKDYPAIKSIAQHPLILKMLQQLYGRKPLPFQTLNFPIGTEQRVHSDTIHFDSDPATYMCGVWVALEDIDESNGALVYYPGSHKLKKITMEDVAPGPGTHHYHLYEDYVENFIKKSGIPPARAIIKKGQALIWASNLYHGGGSHTDKKRTRHSQVTHYFFEGCQYYTPLESYGGYRFLRIDEWVK